VEEGHLPTVSLRGLRLEAAGHEREQIAADGLGLRELETSAISTDVVASQLAVRNRRPVRRDLEAQPEAAFQTGLIEERQSDPGPIGNEERVEKLVVAIE
jgi:hypothetical protein